LIRGLIKTLNKGGLTMKKRRLLLVLGTMCIAITLAIFPFGEASGAEKRSPIKLKLASYHPPTSDCVQVLQSYVPIFKEVTGGSVLLEIYDSETLVKGPEHVDAIQRGMVDLALSWPSYLGQTFPIADLGVQTMIWRDLKGIHDAYDNGLAKILEEGYAAVGLDNVSVLGMIQLGDHRLLTKNEVKVPSDLKGLRLRSSGASEVELIKLCGAAPTSTRIGEAYEALQRGIINGAIPTLGNLHDFKWTEQAKYVLDLPIHQAPMQLLASKKSLDNIPSDLKPVVMELLKGCMTKMELIRALNNIYYYETYLPKVGVIFYKPTEKEKAQWIALGQKVFAQWVSKAGERGKRAVAIIDKYNK
jgi:TRAP-type C4-dicarboxylate transport system substrate-binding protein